MTAVAPQSPIAPARASAHWLVQTASRAGLAGADEMNIPVGINLTDAWDIAGRSLGLSMLDLAAAIARAMRLKVADFDKAVHASLRLVPEKLARSYQVFPISDDDRSIAVATADPFDLVAEQQIEFASGRRVRFEIAPPHLIAEAIAAEYSPDRAIESLLASASGGDVGSEPLQRGASESARDMADVTHDNGPVVRLANLIIVTAARQGASDIHIEPGPRTTTVRFRIDGVMRHHMHAPPAVALRVVSRIKVMANIDIVDRFKPHDGRAKMTVDGAAIDLRVSTIPTRESEKVVIRLLRPEATRVLDQIGFAPHELARLRQLVGHRDGIVIVTGPTGSGKTTTMYGAIREIANGDINVMTIEDPIEYEMPGITQIQVEPKRDVTFTSALRAILRQDPDVIFVGEIRDLETAEIAIQASRTGHLVLATSHANDALGAISRLMDLGVDRASIASTLRGAVAQRLVRRLCPDCRLSISGPLTLEETRLAGRYGATPTMRAAGCSRCGNTGYRGRIPVAEVAIVDTELSASIANAAEPAFMRRTAAQGGMRSLRTVALELAAKGETTFAEVDRVLGEVEGAAPELPIPEVRVASALRTVLIVDDDAVLRLMSGAILTKAGYAVLTAIDGVDALEMLAAHPNVDLILTDLHMPKLSGAELMARVRMQPETSAIPVIVVTGSATEGDNEVELMDAGADDYLRKPVDPPRLVARVRAALRRSVMTDDSARAEIV